MKSLIKLLIKSGRPVQSLQPNVGDIVTHENEGYNNLSEWRIMKIYPQRISIISVLNDPEIKHTFGIEFLLPEQWKYK